ncbi:MAG: DUF4873 domain-containing protein [Marmoricola sp.]
MSTPVTPAPQHDDQHDDQYAGPATLVLDGTPLPVRVHLRGHLEPIDGRFHWWGRMAADADLDVRASGSPARLTTPRGSAEGRLCDADPWGRLRIAGVGRPPF